MIVIDSSTLAKYLLREEGWREVEKYLLKPTCSVEHMVKEVLNAVWKHTTIHKYISKNTALTIYSLLKKLIDEGIIVLEPQEKYVSKAFRIAIDNNITIYDALYIAQALEYGKLLTSDTRQAKVAEKLGVKTILIT